MIEIWFVTLVYDRNMVCDWYMIEIGFVTLVYDKNMFCDSGI
jgi:hypothetical protein